MPTSIGFCLKHDDIDNFERLLSTKGDKREDSVIWSPFEWTKMSEKRDLLLGVIISAMVTLSSWKKND